MYVITSPTGPYFPSGFKPVNLYANPKYVRAFPGGVGNYKCGSNYGPTVFVNIEANKKGCQQPPAAVINGGFQRSLVVTSKMLAVSHPKKKKCTVAHQATLKSS